MHISTKSKLILCIFTAANFNCNIRNTIGDVLKFPFPSTPLAMQQNGFGKRNREIGHFLLYNSLETHLKRPQIHYTRYWCDRWRNSKIVLFQFGRRACPPSSSTKIVLKVRFCQPNGVIQWRYQFSEYLRWKLKSRENTIRALNPNWIDVYRFNQSEREGNYRHWNGE